MTPAGIEKETFRFVAQHLNHSDTAVTKYNRLYRRLVALVTNWKKDLQEITAWLHVSLFNKHLCEKKTKITKASVPVEIRETGLPKKIIGAMAWAISPSAKALK